MRGHLYFAHLTDIHISEREHTWSTVSLLAPQLLREAFDHLNRLDDLDFVMITGDILDVASERELDLFLSILGTLKKPWHFIPGNHDGFVDPQWPTALKPHEVIERIDQRMCEHGRPDAQSTYWSRELMPGVQLLGLDSRLAHDWGGEVNAGQFEWLQMELDRLRDKMVILAVHHPLHPLGNHNSREPFIKFVCANGAGIETLLDRHRNVKLVLSGHHHVNQLVIRGGRLNIHTSALSGYPCSYRTIRMVNQGNEGWHTRVETHTTATPPALEKALEVAMIDRMAHAFDGGDPVKWVTFCAGRPQDQAFDGVL